jgi:hypothetical protein
MTNNIPCSALTDALTALAQNTAPVKKYNTVTTIPRSQHTCYLADTAEAVREVARKMSKPKKKKKSRKHHGIHFNTLM